MKLIDQRIWIEFPDFIESGWKEDTIKKANLRNGSYWQMMSDPSDKRKVLVRFDTLRVKDQEKLIAKFGDPANHIAQAPIKQLLTVDGVAEVFFKNYRYADNRILPAEHQARYTVAASWLNLVKDCLAKKNFIKKDLQLTIDQFWTNVSALIKQGNVALPSSYRKLLAQLKEYEQEGYASIVSGHFGNKKAAKIGKTTDGFNEDTYDKQVALIRAAASKHQNYDAQQITSAVNTVFAKNNWETLSRSTVYSIMQQNSHLTAAGSRGKREYHNSISMQHKRDRPAYPLYYFTLDGWTVELLYQDGSTYHNRLVVVIVLDAFNNYPIGYAIGDRENTDLIRQANRNAQQHTAELFGGHYQPRQLQSDNYGIKNLTPFYQAMSHLHTPAAVGNAKSKVIEPYFKYLNKNYCQRFPNWSGFNLNSKKSNQPNVEFLDKIKKDFPSKAGVIAQIEMIIAQERKIKLQQYLAAWSACPENEKLIMGIEDMLMVFGKPHTHTNSITGQGIVLSIDGKKLTYDSFDPAFRELRHLKWQVIYDAANTSHVLAVTEDRKRRFVLEQKRSLPMDVHSMTADDYAYSKRITDFNKVQMEKVVKTYITDNQAVAEILDTTPLALDDYDEASIKLMFTHNGQQKERLQDAKGLKQVQQMQERATENENTAHDNAWQQLQADYLRSKNDFNQYLD